MTDNARSTPERLRENVADEMAFMTDLHKAVQEVCARHNRLEDAETPGSTFERDAFALGVYYAFQIAEARHARESAEEAAAEGDETTDQSASWPLLYDSLLMGVDDAFEKVRAAFLTTGDDVLDEGIVWAEDLIEASAERLAEELEQDEDDAATAESDAEPTQAESAMSRDQGHETAAIEVPVETDAYKDDDFCDQLALDACHMGLAKLHTAVHGPNVPMDGCGTSLPDKTLLSLFRFNPVSAFEVDLDKLHVDNRRHVTLMTASLALVFNRLLPMLAKHVDDHVDEGDGDTPTQRDIMTALILVPWLQADGLQNLTRTPDRNLVSHTRTATTIAMKTIPDAIATMRVQGSSRKH